MTGYRWKYHSLDPRYADEFESALDAYLKSLPLTQLLLDLRGETISERPGFTRSPDLPEVQVFHPSAIRGDMDEGSPARLLPSVFVSYHHGRDADARERFERENGSVVRSSSIYPGEISRGPEVRREIRKRIAGCDFVVVLIGRDTYSRRWVDWEVRAALTCSRDRRPVPVLGILLPEMQELGSVLADRLTVNSAESATAIRARSDQLSRDLMAAYGTTIPPRLLDNLLSGYAAMVSWPSSPDSLHSALTDSAGRSSPVNGRRLVARNADVSADDEPIAPPEQLERSTPKVFGRPLNADTIVDPDNSTPGEGSESEGISEGQGYGSAVRSGRSPESQSITVSVPRDLSTEQSAAWLVRALQHHGPTIILNSVGNEPDNAVLETITMLRRHSHILAPLDCDTSMAATLLTRIKGDRGLTALTDHLAQLIQGPHLIALRPLPDIPQSGLLQVLSSGEPGIVAIAADQLGRWLASLMWDGTLQIWDSATGAIRHISSLARESDRHRRRTLVADPRGNWLASGGSGSSVDIWDPLTGARIHSFSASGCVVAIATDEKGAWLAAADSIGVIQVWSMPTGSAHVRLGLAYATYVSALVIDPEGRWLAAGGGNSVRVWDIPTGHLLHEFDSPGFIHALAVDPHGAWLCSAGHGATVRIWPMPDGEPIRNLTNRARVGRKETRCLAVDPGGRWIATGGREAAVRTWSTITGTPELVLTGHRGNLLEGVQALTVAADGSWLASAGADRTIRVWATSNGVQRHCFTSHTDDINALATDRSSRRLISGSSDGSVRIWDPTTEPQPSLHDSGGSITALTADRSGSWYAFAGRDTGRITICHRVDAAQHDFPTSYVHHESNFVTALASDPNGTWLASAGKDGTVRIWDPRKGIERYFLVGRGHDVEKEVATRLTAAPNGRWLACSDNGPQIRIWSPILGERLNTLSNISAVKDVVIDPSGTWLASACADGAIRLWNPEASRPHRVLAGHRSSARALAVDPSGEYLVSCGDDATVRIWDLEDSSESVLHLSESAERLEMCPRGSLFAAADSRGTVRICDPRKGAERCTFDEPGVAGMAFDPTGRYLATVASDATIRIWLSSTGAPVTSLRVGGALRFVNWTPHQILVGGACGAYVFALRESGSGR
ncbi:TIR domain-containing protein [Nocardia amamiensis]|uniref:TIR domain-containing protein n=1 Tax=Nocardia amamiensis TaxID=404578 RepID=UPI001470D38B|nr:TIR domain-containing protein [Nocardia amamiensis]